MSTSATHYQSVAKGLSARYAFFRHLNANTLAFVLFVALALLGNTRAKESQNNASNTDAGLVVRPCGAWVSPQQQIHGNSLSLAEFAE